MNKKQTENDEQTKAFKRKQRAELTELQHRQPVTVSNRQNPMPAPFGSSNGSSSILSRQPSSVLSRQPSALLQRSVSEEAETSNAYPQIKTGGRNFAQFVGQAGRSTRIQAKPLASPIVQREVEDERGTSWKHFDQAANKKRLAHAKEDYLFDKSVKGPGQGVTAEDRSQSAEELERTNVRLGEQARTVRDENDVPWPPPNPFFLAMYKFDPTTAVDNFVQKVGIEGTPTQKATIHARAKAKDNIPEVKDILTPDQIAAHLGKFAKGAHTFTDPNTEKYIEGELEHPKPWIKYAGWGRPDDANFVAPLDEANALNAKAQAEGGIELIEDELGIWNKDWSNSADNPDKQLTRWVIPKPKLSIDSGDEGILLKMATGREGGAYDEMWVAGGLTKGGASEVVLSSIPRLKLVEFLAKGTIKKFKETYPKTRDGIYNKQHPKP